MSGRPERIKHMNTNVTFSEWTKPAVVRQTATKARILLLMLLTALAVRNSQSESAAATPAVPSTPAGVVIIQQTYPGMPWLDYSKTPWLKQPPQAQTENAGSVERLLADL